MEAIILVISWTLFSPPAHDINVKAMPDISSCQRVAQTVTKEVSDLEKQGVQAKIVARCISVPAGIKA